MPEKTNKKTFRLSDNDINSIELIKEYYGLSSDTAAIEYALNKCVKNLRSENDFLYELKDKMDDIENEIIRVKASARQSEDYGYILVNVLNSIYKDDNIHTVLWPYHACANGLFKQAKKRLEIEKRSKAEIYRNNLKMQNEDSFDF